MKESPILMQGWKVRRILEWDWDTYSAGYMQTRRAIDHQPFSWAERFEPAPFDDGSGVTYGKAGDWIQMSKDAKYMLGLGRCRYGGPGDLLWVKETFTYGELGYIYKAALPKDQEHPKWKSSLYMPKNAARLWLEVVKVGVERIQDITTDDILKEGIKKTDVDGYYLAPLAGVPDFPWGRADLAFAALWTGINGTGDRGWVANPWVWVVTYKLHAVIPSALLLTSNS